MQTIATSHGTTQSSVLTSDDCRPEPRSRHSLLHLVRDVAAEEVEGAVGHVHDPHEPEDEREPARHDEEEPGEREPVEDRGQEGAEVVERRAGVRRAPVPAATRGRGLREEEDVGDPEQDQPARDEPGR